MAGKKRPAPQDDGKVQLRILRNHDHKLSPARLLAFKAGSEPWVDPAVAEALIAAGAADLITDTAQTED